MIIPFFIPHAGCPHQCVFCNQKKIAGHFPEIDAATISTTIRAYLATNQSGRPAQVAFYGGTFTALPSGRQRELLGAIQTHIAAGEVDSIRLSTRPDRITPDILAELKKAHVHVVELGVQSMDQDVLRMAGRGHSAANVRDAVSLLREYGFLIGIQLMPGLPGDNEELFRRTVTETIALAPDIVRLYPALVIRDTVLAEMYQQGHYSPLSLSDAVEWCREAYERFDAARITVIRMGLQPTADLRADGTIIAGPYHPAFRQLVMSSRALLAMRSALMRRPACASAAFLANPRELSDVLGQKRANIIALKKDFGLATVTVTGSESVERGALVLLEES